MEQDVAELLAYFRFLTVKQRLGKLVYFFDRVGTETLVGLLGIPRTFYAKDVESVDDASERGKFFIEGVRCIIFRHTVFI